VALVLADAMRFKFGGDSLEEALANFGSYAERGTSGSRSAHIQPQRRRGEHETAFD